MIPQYFVYFLLVAADISRIQIIVVQLHKQMNKYYSVNPQDKRQIEQLLSPIFEAVRKNKIHSYHQLQSKQQEVRQILSNMHANNQDNHNASNNPRTVSVHSYNQYNKDKPAILQNLNINKRKSYYIFEPKPKTAITTFSNKSEKYSKSPSIRLDLGKFIKTSDYKNANMNMNKTLYSKNQFNYTYNSMYSPLPHNTINTTDNIKNLSVHSSRVSQLSPKQSKVDPSKQKMGGNFGKYEREQKQTEEGRQRDRNQNIQQNNKQGKNRKKDRKGMRDSNRSEQNHQQYIPHSANKGRCRMFRVNSKIKKHLVQQIDFQQIEKMFYKKRQKMTRYEHFLKLKNQQKSKISSKSKQKHEGETQLVKSAQKSKPDMLEDTCNDKYIDKYMIKLKQRQAPGRARITRSKRDNIIIDNDACAYDISKISKINQVKPPSQLSQYSFDNIEQQASKSQPQSRPYNYKSPSKRKFWLKQSVKKINNQTVLKQSRIVQGTSISYKTMQLPV